MGWLAVEWNEERTALMAPPSSSKFKSYGLVKERDCVRPDLVL